MLTMVEIGSRLREAREKKVMSQQQLSACLSERGFSISRETISKMENGSRSISVVEVKAIAGILSINLDELLELNETQEDFSLTALYRKKVKSNDTAAEEVREIQEIIVEFVRQLLLQEGKINTVKRQPLWNA